MSGAHVYKVHCESLHKKRASSMAADAYISISERAASITSKSSRLSAKWERYRSIDIWNATRYGRPISRYDECRCEATAQPIRLSTKALSL
jgi:hypothetical protein